MTPEPPETFACPECGHDADSHPRRDYSPCVERVNGLRCKCDMSQAYIFEHHLTESRAALRAAEAENRRFRETIETVAERLPETSVMFEWLQAVLDASAAVPRPEGETP